MKKEKEKEKVGLILMKWRDSWQVREEIDLKIKTRLKRILNRCYR